MFHRFQVWEISLSVFSLYLGFGLCDPGLTQLPNFVPPPPTGVPTNGPTDWPQNVPQNVPLNVPQNPAVNLPTEFQSSTYILGPGDQININVFEHPDLTGTQVILPDGTITLPLIGKIVAVNRTPDQLAQELTSRLAEWLVEPFVTVGIVNLRPVLVNVAGEVQRPGPQQLNTTERTNFGVSTAQLPTLSAALLQAGGITQKADIRSIILTRVTPGGDTSSIMINLWDSLYSASVSRDLLLQDGDSIFVPALSADESMDTRLVARSSVAPETVRVRVVGEVTRPGEVQVPPSSSISSAVAIAGGPTDRASLAQVGLIRLREDGSIEEATVDIRNLTDTYQIQDGDVIIVPKTRAYRVLDIAGDLINPLDFLLDFFRGF